jgi:hypothetical protein
MSLQVLDAPVADALECVTPTCHSDFDLDAIDRAIDHGDLDTVREELGFSRPAWRLLLQRL